MNRYHRSAPLACLTPILTSSPTRSPHNLTSTPCAVRGGGGEGGGDSVLVLTEGSRAVHFEAECEMSAVWGRTN